MQKTLLGQLLSNKPQDTKAQLTNAFARVSSNFEFAVSVDMSKTQQHMDEASGRGFAPVWCNSDATSAILYSAAQLTQDRFTDVMTWLNSIRTKDDVALVHFAGGDGVDRIVEIK